jgi:hypothetical protein
VNREVRALTISLSKCRQILIAALGTSATSGVEMPSLLPWQARWYVRAVVRDS